MTTVYLKELVRRKIGYGIVQPGDSRALSIPVIKVNNIISGLNSIDALDKTTPTISQKYSRTILQGGELLVSVVGTIGKTAIVPNSFAGCNIARAVAMIDIQDPIMALWVKYFIDSPQGQAYIIENLNTTVQPTLNIKDLENMPVPLFDRSQLERRVEVLRSLDDKMVLNNRINHNLEEQAQALYKSWFVDFEPFKDGEFVDSELGMIPAGWRVGTLSELGDIVAGGTPSKAKPEYYTNNGIAWLTPKDLSAKCNKFTAKGETDITEDGYKNSSAKLMPRGSILFSSRAPIGYISIAKGDICTNQGFKSVVPRYAGTAYLYYWLSEHTDAIEAQASGSTFKEASGSLMKTFPAIIPDKNVLDSFEKELAPILNEQEILEEEIFHTDQIRTSVLPRLLSGELVINC